MSRFLLLGFAAFGLVATTSPPVEVELRSSWEAPPPLLETLEAITVEEPYSFFALLDAITNPEGLPSPLPSSPKEVHEHVIAKAISEGFLSHPGALASVEMAMALHAPSPKIEAFFQYYNDRQAHRVENISHSNCESWVDWYGQVVCDVDTLAQLIGVDTIEPPDGGIVTYSRPRLLPFDHIHPPPSRTLEHPPRTAIFYAAIGSGNFRELHDYLYEASTDGSPRVEYVIRPIPSKEQSTSHSLSLTGYGVALDLKKMEYLALDDRRQGSEKGNTQSDEVSDSTSEVDPIISLINQYPENFTAEYTTPPTPSELLQIGFQCAQLVYDSEEPLAILKRLTQDFPKYATTIARRVTVQTELEEEVQSNHAKAQPGVNMVWLNGLVVPETDMNPFSLLRTLRKERNTMESLMSLGLTSIQSFELLTHPSVSVAQSQTGVLDGIFDASDRPEGGGIIVWWNDFENDSRYSRWGASIHILLRPLYPGQFPNVKRNLFNIVLAVDLSQSSALNFIAGTVFNLIDRNLPFRFGVVPLLETSDGARMARLFYWLIENIGRDKTMQFLVQVSQVQDPLAPLTPTVSWSLVRSAFQSVLSDVEDPEIAHVELDDVLEDKYDKSSATLGKALLYSKRLGTDLLSSPHGHAFVNGKQLDLDDDFLRHMQMEIAQQLQHFQEQVYLGKLSDRGTSIENISTYFYDLPQSNKRRNKYIYPSAKTGSLRIHNLAEVLDRSSFPSSPDSFVYSDDAKKHLVTTFVVADLDEESGLRIVKEALSSIEGGNSRISFIHNPTAEPSAIIRREMPSFILSRLISQGLLSRISPSRLLGAFGLGDTPIPTQDDQVVITSQDTLDDVLSEPLIEGTEEALYDKYMRSSRLFIRELRLSPGEQALVVNGRVVGPLGDGDFVADDFEALAKFEYSKRVEPIVGALQDVLASDADLERAEFDDVVFMASSIISSIQLPDASEAGLFNTPHRARRRNYQLLDGNYTKFEFGQSATALYHFGILVDPLSETAQKYASIIEWLLNNPAVYVELHINPARHRELPLKRYYRYNLPGKTEYDHEGEEVKSFAMFRDLPVEPLYTLAMDVAPSWLVRPREAQYDLDNIQLNVLKGHDRVEGVRAVFGLDYLVVEGHARDLATNSPPRGLQLQLTASNGSAIADTQVVANLGYLQFRTKPGVFQLEIRPGRGREIFEMQSVGNEGWDSPVVEKVGNEITLTSFEGLTLYPRVVRVPGMERADVLAVDEPHAPETSLLGDIFSRISSMFSKPVTNGGTDVAYSGHADINIFTVASGLLYERFASIMILSVLRNTNSTVKFWFIENFLSPSFLEFIPYFAEAYNFKYELVTYKWPSWLRAQKEKQRIIWAYKILFLDVLFPMDLKKVIFVDADQIVRADLKELVDLDLHGAPYGYTPMGDDNVEMEGFRFWKTGYWREFLRGLPYHISALYVVDLIRFRQVAAGDMLRGHYQQLSADPNSLANLDQDLPNNLQREVTIFSLPEDWLWCETWCSKDRLHRAKTIDLCQNPLTKEPKLSRAHQIPEWSTYDSEIAQFAKSLAEQGILHSGIAAVDSNVLANAGASTPTPEEDDKVQSKDEGDKPTASDYEHVKDEL